jgi:6-phosphogluconate dehydrogenase
MKSETCDIGLVGLGVMGASLARNIADHGFGVAVWNRSADKARAFARDAGKEGFGPGGGEVTAAEDLRGFAAMLTEPRRIILLVPAGEATDQVIDALSPLLSRGDILIDCGNAHWEDTDRREARLRERGLRFVGCGISGGEQGARFGPSLMPGGDPSVWREIAPVFTAIAAKVDRETGREILGAAPGRPVRSPGAEPCAAYVGPQGAGHFVKMVHNGIEYADMQLICEAYHLLRAVGGHEPAAIAQVFASWQKGELDSYLVEITADILAQKDPVTGEPFVDVVLDAAGQKGTGKWTSQAALDAGVPAATIAEAVFARAMSAIKEERVRAGVLLPAPPRPAIDPSRAFVDAVEQALLCAKVCAYAQGFSLMATVARERGWGIDFGALAGIWRGGCIIRARLLERIRQAYARDGSLASLLLDSWFADVLGKGQAGWRLVAARAATAGVPAPALMSALAHYDGYRTARLPAGLLQAQRDFFGAHTYERVDRPRGRFFHLAWSEPGRPERSASHA